MLSAKDVPARCAANTQMKLAAERGNYSARIAYSAFVLEGRFVDCSDVATREQVAGFVKAARPQVDGFFETLLAEHLASEATRGKP
jgi:hypothetical protein